MSNFAESHSEMELYCHSTRANLKLQWVALGAVIKDTACFHSKRKKEEETLKISFDPALKFIVMHQGEVAKDRKKMVSGRCKMI